MGKKRNSVGDVVFAIVFALVCVVVFGIYVIVVVNFGCWNIILKFGQNQVSKDVAVFVLDIVVDQET